MSKQKFSEINQVTQRTSVVKLVRLVWKLLPYRIHTDYKAKTLHYYVASLVAQTVKHLSTMWETRVQSLGWEDLLDKDMAIHSSILAWKSLWMEELGRLQSMASQRVRHDWVSSLSLPSVAKVWPMGKVSSRPSLTRTFLICICWPSKVTENVPIHSCGSYGNIPFTSATAECMTDQWLPPSCGSSTKQRRNIAMGRFRGQARRIHHFSLPFIGHNSTGREM